MILFVHRRGQRNKFLEYGITEVGLCCIAYITAILFLMMEFPNIRM